MSLKKKKKEKRKKTDACMNKSGRIHACPQSKKVDRTKKKKKKTKKDECMSMNKSGWTTKKNKKLMMR